VTILLIFPDESRQRYTQVALKEMEFIMTSRSILVAGLALLMAVCFPLQVVSASKKPIIPSQQWSGSMADLSLSKAVPEVILTEEGLKNLWKVWKIEASMPKVDFSRNLIVVQTTRGSRLRLSATLDDKGDLKVLGAATADLRPGFRYVVAVLSREGVKTVNGKELAPKAEQASPQTSSNKEHDDFGVSDIEVQSVKTLDPGKLNAEVRKAAGKGEDWTKNAVLVALKFTGAGLKGHTKTIEARTPPEERDTATITVSESGYLDDAISGERWRLWLKKDANGSWTIQRALWAQLCDRPGRRFYSAEKCP
jgi:hypothetical protein